MRILILSMLLLFSIPVQATDCTDMTTALNEIIAANPGSRPIVTYDSLDALTYIGLINGFPTGKRYVVGDAVIVVGAKKYPSVIAVVFHGRCSADQFLIPAYIHRSWDGIIIGFKS